MIPPSSTDRLARQQANFVRRRPHLLARNRIRKAMNDYFLERDFQEVETPILQVSPGLEPHLHAFETGLVGPDGQKSTLYLHTSPEFAMKKLLALGEPRLFQFARVFRNGERAATHHPEFTMLEWYRAGESYLSLIDDCESLIRAAARAAGTDLMRFGGKTCDPTLAFERIRVREAFSRYAGIELACPPAREQPDRTQPDRAQLAEQAHNAGVRIAHDDSWDDTFFKVFLEKIEPHLGVGRASVLMDYPIHMAALSRPQAQAPNLAERFEIYICGLELANAFGELTDAAEQERRFARDMALKAELYGTTYPIDPEFLEAVGHLPDCSGIALGFDRLVMLCTGAERIDDVLWLPVAIAGLGNP